MSFDIVVVGSANVDHVVHVDRLPRAGETVSGREVVTGSGGKGANQAQAAARLGASVALVACVGDDAGGAFLRARLQAAGVDVQDVHRAADAPTGVALVTVDSTGENTVAVGAGANALLTPSAVLSAVDRLRGSRIVLAQGEVPPDTLEAAADLSSQLGARLVLNLAPVIAVPSSVLAAADPLILNEHEAVQLLAGADEPDEKPPPGTGAALLAKTVSPTVVITLGEEGAVWAGREGTGRLPAVRVPEVVDTTGAGDAFVAALATALADDVPLALAVARGIVVGSHVVTMSGASPDLPAHDAVASLARRLLHDSSA